MAGPAGYAVMSNEIHTTHFVPNLPVNGEGREGRVLIGQLGDLNRQLLF